jgi:isochorismate hydrolase
MTALFADKFYWIALADFSDNAHRHALALTAERKNTPIVTTDEVLGESYLFCDSARADAPQSRYKRPAHP